MENSHQTGIILRKLKTEILRKWEEEVRKLIRASEWESSASLRDSIPYFLDDLIHALETNIDEVKPELLQFAHKHGAERANLSYFTIEDAITEYNVLRKVIFNLIEGHQNEIGTRARDIIYEAINLGLAKAGAEYAKTQIRSTQKLNEELQVTNETLNLALDISSTGIFRVNLQTHEVELSPREREIYDLDQSIKSAPYKDLIQYIHFEDREIVEAKINDSIRNKDIFRFEFRILRRNGEIRWLAGVGKAIFSEKGDATHVVGTNVDITESKLAKEEIENLAERLQLITDIQPALIAYIDKDYRYRFVNDTFGKWFKVNPKEMLGRTLEEMIGELFPKVKIQFRRALTGETVKFKHYVNYPIGTKFVEVTYKPHITASGEIRGVFVSVDDLTEEKNIIDHLKHNEAQFISLANSIPQLAWVASGKGDVIWSNQRWYDFTGLTLKETMESNTNIQKHAHENSPWEDTVPLKSKDGEWHWFLLRAVPVLDENQKVTRWFGTYTDITNQKVLNDQLQEEQILRDKFISTLSHDLRTPLTAAKMSAQIIARKTTEPQLHNLTFRIEENLTRADKMIQDLLDASAIRAGQELPLEQSEFDAVAVIESILDNLITIHGDRFVLEAPESLKVNFSETGLTRVVENLCTNAIKYGSVTEPIIVSLDKQDGRIELIIRNSRNPQIHIDKAKLFDPFFRGQSKDVTAKKGWGIGLTIVKGIVEAYGGEVRVNSDDQITEFHISIPSQEVSISHHSH